MASDRDVVAYAGSIFRQLLSLLRNERVIQNENTRVTLAPKSEIYM